jgi:hypothetical protein
MNAWATEIRNLFLDRRLPENCPHDDSLDPERRAGWMFLCLKSPQPKTIVQKPPRSAEIRKPAKSANQNFSAPTRRGKTPEKPAKTRIRRAAPPRPTRVRKKGAAVTKIAPLDRKIVNASSVQRVPRDRPGRRRPALLKRPTKINTRGWPAEKSPPRATGFASAPAS